jgi:competence protein ComEA
MRFKSREAVGVVALLLVVGALAGWRWLGSPARTPLVFEEPREAAEGAAEGGEPAPITVHVAGAVLHPGVYTIKAGSRAVDALKAAGGAHPDADEHAFNLAQPLYDGQRIEIPYRRGDGPGPGAGRGESSSLININTATAGELESLPNIGPARAAMIVEYRERHGYFKSVEELTRVPGIGEKILASFRDLVTIY